MKGEKRGQQRDQRERPPQYGPVSDIQRPEYRTLIKPTSLLGDDIDGIYFTDIMMPTTCLCVSASWAFFVESTATSEGRWILRLQSELAMKQTMVTALTDCTTMGTGASPYEWKVREKGSF